MTRKSLKNQPYNARRCANQACGKIFQPRVYAGGLQSTCDACDKLDLGDVLTEALLKTNGKTQ